MGKAKAIEAVSKGMLNVEEAAECLGVQPSTIRSWILRSLITYTKVGRAVRISSDEIRRIVEEGTRPAKRKLTEAA